MKWITVTLPEDNWDLIVETLEMDASSSVFDRELREQLRQALDSIVVIETREAKK